MLGVAGLLLASAIAPPGQAFPTEPVRVVIAFPPGGTSTTSNAPVAEYLKTRWSRPLELVYHPGAGGNVAAQVTLKAPADGHTLFYGHAGPLAINHHIEARSFFDPRADFLPVTLAVDYPLVVAISPSVPGTTLRAFVEHARGRPGQLVFGSSGNGSYQHLSGESFAAMHRLRFLHVPFAGGGPLQKSFAEGKIQVLFETGSNVVRHILDGRMKGLAVLSPERLPVLPEIPTAVQAGVPPIDAAAWFGYLAPRGTPPAVLERLRADFDAALRDPGVVRALTDLGARVRNLGPEAFAQFIAAEDRRLGAIVRSAGIKPD